MSNKIEFISERDPNYRRIHISGFWGGINSNGELDIDLIEDTPFQPERIMITFKEGSDDIISEERIPCEEGLKKIRRIQHVGVVIPTSALPGIISWLQQQLDRANTIK